MLNFLYRVRRKILGLLLLLLALALLVHRNAQPGAPHPSFLRRAVHGVWDPLQGSFKWVLGLPLRLSDEIRSFLSWRRERERMERELQLRRLDLSRQQALESELEKLRETLRIRKALPRRMVAARVAAHDPSTWHRSFVIEAGRREGIFPDAPVLAEGGVVGRILEAGEIRSQVLLLLDPQSSVAGVDARSRVRGVARGTGRNFLRYAYVDAGADVQPGDPVVTSGMGGIFPAGYPLGTVVEVSPSENGLTLDVVLAPSVDFGLLEYVFVAVEGDVGK